MKPRLEWKRVLYGEFRAAEGGFSCDVFSCDEGKASWYVADANLADIAKGTADTKEAAMLAAESALADHLKPYADLFAKLTGKEDGS